MKRKRLTSRAVNEEESSSPNFTFEQAYEYFLSSKKAEGLRKPTLISYHEHFNFYNTWLKKSYSEVGKRRFDKIQLDENEHLLVVIFYDLRKKCNKKQQ